MDRVDAKTVATGIREAISEGEFAIGQALPTTEELRARFGGGKNTISAAVQQLKGEGILTGVGGGRTRVRVPPIHQARSNERYLVEKRLVLEPEDVRRANGISELDTSVKIAEVHQDAPNYEVVSPTPEVMDFLRIPDYEYVLRRTYLRQNAEGAGFDRHVSYIPYSIVKNYPELLDSNNEPWPGGTLHQLHYAGVEAVKIVDQVSARMPTAEESELHDIPFNVPVIAIRKITFASGDRPVELSYLLIPADRVSLSYVTPLPPSEG